VHQSEDEIAVLPLLTLFTDVENALA